MRTRAARIYGLFAPGDPLLKYVGRTVQPLWLRLQTHVDSVKHSKSQCPRVVWIRELVSAGLKPRIMLIEEVPESDAEEAEGFWMDYFRFFGLQLLNTGSPAQGRVFTQKITWTPELDAMLGTVADSVIAEMLGVTRKSISYRRACLKVPASHDRTRSKPPPSNAGWNRITLDSEVIERLGTISDAQLAREAGVSKKRITIERNARGVTSFADRTGNHGRYKAGNYPRRWLKKST